MHKLLLFSFSVFTFLFREV